MIKRILRSIVRTADRLLMWNAINWPFVLIIPPIVLLILLMIYAGIY